MADERLNIVITESGSQGVAEAMRRIAAAVDDAGGAIASLKKALQDLKVGDVRTQLDAVGNSINKINTSAKTGGKSIDRLAGGLERLSQKNVMVAQTSETSSDAIRRLRGELVGTDGASKKASRGIRQAGKASKFAATGFSDLAKQAFVLKATFRTLGGALVAREYLQMTDTFQNLSNKIRLVTNSTEEMTALRSDLFELANATRQDADATITTFTRLQKATKGQGISSKELMRVQETLNKMMAISGATAMEAGQSIRQLSQAFSKGKLDGDEFRSVAENMPPILDALEKSLGVTRGEIRDMAEQGKLTTDVLLKAFGEVADDVDKDFKKSVTTLGQAWTVLTNKVLEAVGSFNEGSGAASIIIGALKLLANNLDIIIQLIKVTTLWFGVKGVQALIAWGATMRAKLIESVIPQAMKMLKGLNRQIKLTRAGMMSLVNPIAAIGLGVAMYWDDITSVGEAVADAILGIEEPAKTTEEALNRMIDKNKRKVKELEAFKSMAWAHNKAAIEEEIAKIDERNDGNQRYLDMLKKQEEEERKIAAAQARQDKARAEYAEWAKAYGAMAKAQKAYGEQVVKVMEAESTGVINAGQAKTAREALWQAYRDQLKPATALVEAAEKELAALRMTNKQRAIAAKMDAARAKLWASDPFGMVLGRYAGQLADLEKKYAEIFDVEERNKKRGKKDKFPGQFASLRGELDPIFGARTDAKQKLGILKKGLAKGLIDEEQYAGLYKQLGENMRDALRPMEAMEDAHKEQVKLLGMSKQEVAAYNMQKQIEDQLMQDLGVRYDDLAAKRAKEMADERIAAQIAAENARALEQEVKALEDKYDTSEKYLKTVHAIAEAELQGRISARAAAMERAQLDRSRNLQQDEQQMLQKMIQQQVWLSDAEQKRIATKNKLIMIDNAAMQLQREMNLTDEERMEIVKKMLKVEMEQVKVIGEWEAAVDSLKQSYFSLEAINQQFANAVSNIYQGLEDQLVNFVQGQKVEWKNMVDSILADMTRLLVRKAITGAAVAAFGPSFLARHGADRHVGADLPRYAHGGQFMVGGAGGPDTKLVQFMASPGERVSVTSPGQTRLDQRNQAQPSGTPAIAINNFVDPSSFGQAMASPAGTKATANAVRLRPNILKRHLR